MSKNFWDDLLLNKCITLIGPRDPCALQKKKNLFTFKQMRCLVGSMHPSVYMCMCEQRNLEVSVSFELKYEEIDGIS